MTAYIGAKYSNSFREIVSEEDLIDKEFFAQDTLSVASKLLGMKLQYNGCEGIIVETEAYRDDAASHAVTKPKKGAMLRETHGCIYIYFIYGMYHCLNFTTEEKGVGAVLIRAMQPLLGLEAMKERRQTNSIKNLTNGPGKLFQAFEFNPGIHGEQVGRSILLQRYLKQSSFEISTSSRVGISKALDLQWRFFIKGNDFVSK